ncbi:amino acid-binding protein [Vibrio sonorensis]|uniref:amino acid-binding protein n=1 Tax=Vibrio sonorensis TaxID=1004316 RepID=UPI0008DA7585|nr:amino acid-binding protein [Vibrio sonorensis]
MYDINVILDNTPGELARFGEVLGKNGIGLEGGGVFTYNNQSHAHFLVKDGEKARKVLSSHSFEVQSVSTPLIRKLKQDQLGQLGAIAKALAEQGVNIIVQYSDHDNQLILVTDNYRLADLATSDWAVKVE